MQLYTIHCISYHFLIHSNHWKFTCYTLQSANGLIRWHRSLNLFPGRKLQVDSGRNDWENAIIETVRLSSTLGWKWMEFWVGILGGPTWSKISEIIQHFIWFITGQAQDDTGSHVRTQHKIGQIHCAGVYPGCWSQVVKCCVCVSCFLCPFFGASAAYMNSKQYLSRSGSQSKVGST